SAGLCSSLKDYPVDQSMIGPRKGIQLVPRMIRKKDEVEFGLLGPFQDLSKVTSAIMRPKRMRMHDSPEFRHRYDGFRKPVSSAEIFACSLQAGIDYQPPIKGFG